MDQAKEVASTAADRGGAVAQEAVAKAKHVAAQTEQETRDLLRESRDRMISQARDGQQKAAQSLHALADQFGVMSERAEGTGIGPDLARQLSERAHSTAHWLEEREPGEVVSEIRGFARRRPGLFLASAAAAGVLAGRLTRGMLAQQQKPQPSGGTESAADRVSSGAGTNGAEPIEPPAAPQPPVIEHSAAPVGFTAAQPHPAVPGSSASGVS
ncbi:hypothetical protein AB0F91_36950 [Amycolatopsis sp. NPDC023774]|uniref:hypothetical protein n=1 Tax=Amycolatopsis sp. NPDC023774 TaxID=3155015 RepID=UPI0033FC7A3B